MRCALNHFVSLFNRSCNIHVVSPGHFVHRPTMGDRAKRTRTTKRPRRTKRTKAFVLRGLWGLGRCSRVSMPAGGVVFCVILICSLCLVEGQGDAGEVLLLLLHCLVFPCLFINSSFSYSFIYCANHHLHYLHSDLHPYPYSCTYRCHLFWIFSFPVSCLHMGK